MNKKIAVVGVVILLIGAAMTGIGYMGIMNDSMDNLADDYNNQSNEFESYDEGDTITITGVITNKSNPEWADAYSYQMDDVEGMGFISGNDIADEGDRITVTVEVIVMNFGQEVQMLEAQSYSNPTLMTPISLLGLLFLVVGVVVAIVGAVKSGKEEEFEQEMPPQQQQQQPPPPEGGEDLNDSSEDEF